MTKTLCAMTHRGKVLRVRSIAIASVAAVLAASALAACGSAGSDKAGGVRHETTVLTLANSLGNPRELQAFADAVAKRSGGALRIRFRNEWRWDEADYERRTIRDVAAGRADLGWAGARAWAALGIHGFDPLIAPLAIDSYDVERKLLESDAVRDAIGTVEPAGVIGIGVLPGPLRYPLAVARALRGPGDYAGLRVGLQQSETAAATLRRLGAEPVEVPPAVPFRGMDAIEQQIASINGRAYDQEAKALTANVPLWPRPMVLFAGRGAVTADQLALLRDAARTAIAPALDIIKRQEDQGMASLCERGIHTVDATGREIAALRAAVAPLLERMRRDRVTGELLGMAERLRAESEAEPALRCGPRAGTTLADGTYTKRVLLDEIYDSGVQRELTKAEIEDDFATNRFMLVLRGGQFTLRVNHRDGQREVAMSGPYSLYRDRFVATGDNGVTVRARFERRGDRLEFHDVTPRGFESAVFGYHGWELQR